MIITGYYKLVALPEEVKVLNKIRSKARLDCISYAGNYKGLNRFINKQGQLFFYKTRCSDFIDTIRKRKAEWSLTNNSLNFSSIYIEDFDVLEYGYGYPNANFKLNNGKLNPLYEYRNDGYLFIVNYDYTQIEILTIPNYRNLISQIYQSLIDGYLNIEIQNIRAKAKPIFEYIGLENAI